MSAKAIASYSALLLALVGCSSAENDGDPSQPAQPGPDLPADVLERLRALAVDERQPAKPDVTNAYADDPAAAALGHKLFFDTRFSGPLLAEDNTGVPGTLGMQYEVGKVSCESCHVAASNFVDTRSSRRQLSLASGWTRRRTPMLLDFDQRGILMWDGRRDTSYAQVISVLDNPLEFNSSRLFTAQQVARLYADEYEAIFGPLPSLDAFEELAPEDAGCATMPEDEVHGRCEKPGHEDHAVLTILANMGKAISAYERLLDCGPSRFDAWMNGDLTALTEEEQAGAVLFVKSGCDNCHSGPNFTDDAFYNVGSGNVTPNFVEPYDDPGAVDGIPPVHVDALNSRGVYSDGDDGRLDTLPTDSAQLRGAFRTPGLRCVGMRPSYMHAGQKRSLEDAILLFSRGGDPSGYQGQKDPLMVPLNFNDEERGALAAFLRALDGPGAAVELTVNPHAEE